MDPHERRRTVPGMSGDAQGSAPESAPATGGNWFDRGGSAYARYRPEYPPELSGFLATVAPERGTAVDVGCGTGQLSVRLARFFATVVGVDPSTDQIAHAAPGTGVRYMCAPAEDLPVADRSAHLITAAQAAHWFDLPAFYAEARRIAVPGAVLALISYGAPELDLRVRERFGRFYRDEIGPYWPPERRLVDTGYAGIDFPFPALAVPRLRIRRTWDLDRLLGYISTWSAVRRAAEAGRTDILESFAGDLAAAWGSPSTPRLVVWPVNVRAGTL